MTPDATPTYTTDDREPVVLVTLSDEVPDDHREAIRASVAEMARRAAQATRRAVERNAEQAELARRTNKPLHDLVAADGDAAAALSSRDSSVDVAASDDESPRPDWPIVTFTAGDAGRSVDAVGAHQVFGAPWHYQWQWHTGEAPSTSTQDRPAGRIELYTHADQNHHWSDAHGGFGVSLSSSSVQSVAGRSLRRTNHRYFVHGGSFGGDATAEGGSEMTALEGGRLLSVARDKRFRRRVSSGERDTYEELGWETGDAIEVGWVMLPGRVYTLNVGCWVFGEAHGGVGTASIGQASMNALVIALTADVTD